MSAKSETAAALRNASTHSEFADICVVVVFEPRLVDVDDAVLEGGFVAVVAGAMLVVVELVCEERVSVTPLEVVISSTSAGVFAHADMRTNARRGTAIDFAAMGLGALIFVRIILATCWHPKGADWGSSFCSSPA